MKKKIHCLVQSTYKLRTLKELHVNGDVKIRIRRDDKSHLVSLMFWKT